MNNSKYRTLVVGMHFKKDVDGKLIINPTPYIWVIGRKLLQSKKQIEKGDIVLAQVQYKNGVKSCKPVLVTDIKNELISKENKKYKYILKILNKSNNL